MAAQTAPGTRKPLEAPRRVPRMPLDIGRAHEWLRIVSAWDPPQRLLALQAAIIDVDATSMDDGERLELLQAVHQPVDDIARELDRRHIGLSLPLSRREAAMAEAVSRLYGHLARGYRAVLQAAENEMPSAAQLGREQLARACHGAIASLTGALLTLYESYMPRPDNVWLEMHGVLQYARSEGLLRKPMSLESPAAGGAGNVLLAYKRALLLGLCDPYHLPYRAVARINGRLTEWAAQTRLVAPSAYRRRGAPFLVDLECDNPAIPCLPHLRAIDEGRCLVLDTTPLTVSLHAELQGIASNADPAGSREAWPELLRTLLIRWGIHPVRQGPRQAAAVECELVAGLRQVELAVYEDTRHAEPPVPATLRFPAELRDESPTGLQVCVEADHHIDAHIGGLVGVRNAAGPARWMVGVVRWARSCDYQRLVLGVFKLGADPLPAIARRVGPTGFERESSEQHACLLFPAPGDPVRGRLVTGAELYEPNSVLLVEADGRRRLLRQGKLVLSTGAVDCFEYTVHSDGTTQSEEERRFVR